jgi:hypothetical protein
MPVRRDPPKSEARRLVANTQRLRTDLHWLPLSAKPEIIISNASQALQRPTKVTPAAAAAGVLPNQTLVVDQGRPGGGCSRCAPRRQVVLGRPQGADAAMSPDEQSLVQRRPFGGYGVWTGLRQACSGSKSEDIGGVSLPVVHPVLGFKPKITLIGSLDTAVPEQLSDDALATLRESLSNVVPNAEADAGGRVLVGVDMIAKTLTIQVEDNGVGIDPQVTPGGRNTCRPGPRLRRARHGATLRAGGLPSPGWHSRLRESGSRSPMLRGANPAVCAHFSAGRPRVYGLGPDPVDRRPLSRPNPPLPQLEQQPGRGG